MRYGHGVAMPETPSDFATCSCGEVMPICSTWPQWEAAAAAHIKQFVDCPRHGLGLIPWKNGNCPGCGAEARGRVWVNADGQGMRRAG